MRVLSPFLAVVACSSLLACGSAATKDDSAQADGGSDGGLTTCTVTSALSSAVGSDAGETIYVCAQGTPTVGFNDFILLVNDSNGQPVDGAALTIQTWMPYMGHGGPTAPTISALGSGLYSVTNCVLTMPGTWQLRTTLAGPLNDTDDPAFNIN